jgi:hypothetical protein
MSAKRTDSNQATIVAALRQFGASVWDLHTVGKGPDILVGYKGKSYPMEVKAPDGKLTPWEIEWRKKWRGNYYIVHTFEEAIEIITEEE